MKRLLLDTHVVLWWLQGSDRFKDSIGVFAFGGQRPV